MPRLSLYLNLPSFIKISFYLYFAWPQVYLPVLSLFLLLPLNIFLHFSFIHPPLFIHLKTYSHSYFQCVSSLPFITASAFMFPPPSHLRYVLMLYYLLSTFYHPVEWGLSSWVCLSVCLSSYCILPPFIFRFSFR